MRVVPSKWFNLITNMKTSYVIQDIRVYRSNEIDSDHYLLCAKVNFPPRWLNKGKKKAPVKQEELFKEDYYKMKA